MLNKTIFRTTEEIKQYVAVNMATDIDTLLPYIRQASRKHLRQILADATYMTLLTKYEEADYKVESMTGVYKYLAFYAQEAISNIAYRLYIPIGNVQASDSGIRISVNDNMKAAFQWQVEDLKESLSKAGFNALDEILLFLELNKAEFPEWVASESYTTQKQYFISTATEFSDFYNINSSRLTYLNIHYIMRRIEDFSIKKVLPEEYFDKLKADQLSGTLSTNNKNILNRYIKPAIALLTVAKGLTERSLDLTDYGVTYREVGGINQEKKTHPLSDDITKVVAALEADGFQYLSDMGKKLNENPEAYEGFVLNQQNTPGLRPTNQASFGIFGV